VLTNFNVGKPNVGWLVVEEISQLSCVDIIRFAFSFTMAVSLVLIRSWIF